MRTVSRRDFIHLGTTALVGAAGVLGAAVYNAGGPSLSQARAYGMDRYGFAAPPLRLQSSYEGKIKQLVVASNHRCSQETEQLGRALADTFGSALVFSESAGEHAGVTNEYFRTRGSYIRDQFLVTADGTLLISPVFDLARRDSLSYANRLLEKLAGKGFAIKCAPFRFVGGQVLQAGNRTLMPRSYDKQEKFIIDWTLHPSSFVEEQLGLGELDFSADNTWLAGEMRKYFRKEIRQVPEPRGIYDAYGMLPDFLPYFWPLRGHIDCVVTPAGERSWLVADNGQGLEILRGVNEAEIKPYLEVVVEHMRRYESKRDAEQFEKRFRNLRTHGTTKLEGDISYYSDPFNTVMEDADETAGMLAGDVLRVPSLVAPVMLRTGPGIGIMYNNAVVESTPERKVAVVPTFGIKALDHAALAVFEKAGYKTVPVSFIETSVYGAGPHCTALEIREPEGRA